MEQKSQKIYLTYYSLLMAQNLSLADYEILPVTALKESIKLNVNTSTMIKNVKLVELNRNYQTVLLNTEILDLI